MKREKKKERKKEGQWMNKKMKGLYTNAMYNKPYTN